MVWLASVDLRKYLALDHPLLLILQTPVPFLPLQIWIEGKATQSISVHGPHYLISHWSFFAR